MAPFESTDHAFINSTDDIEEGTTNQYFTQDRARQSFGVVNQALNPFGYQVFDGQTYIYGGLDLTNGTITYIPPTPVNLSAYAPLDSPALYGTPTVNGNLDLSGTLEVSNGTGSPNDVLTCNASGLPTWTAPSSPTPGDIGDVKIRGTREWWANNTIDPNYSYTGATHGIRAVHFHLNNTNFANPLSNNSSLAITDYFGIRFSAYGATGGLNQGAPYINFPTNHVYFHLGYSHSSDDRLKHNETPITDGLSVINQINVLRYDKALSVTSTNMKREVGMIAQEVQTIPQLSHCVAEPMYEEDNYKMVYQDIHNYHIAATQELYKLVLDLQARIAVLESK
jgi:hypothetical protein